MAISVKEFKQMLIGGANLIAINEPTLTAIDGATGDGDHGVAMLSICRTVTSISNEEDNLTTTLSRISQSILNLGLGSSGPLWGSYYEGMMEGSEQIGDKECLEVEDVKTLLISAFDNLNMISRAKVGDKTMMDALIPANDVFKAGSDIKTMLKEAASAAKIGSDNTVNYVARFGRAKNLGQKAIGHKDAGSVSASLMIQGMSDSINQ